MNKEVYELTIEAQRKPEVLERILRVVRHRGFDLDTLNMHQMNDCNAIKIAVTVSGKRPIDLLYKQLDKLFDVGNIELLANDQYQQNMTSINR